MLKIKHVNLNWYIVKYGKTKHILVGKQELITIIEKGIEYFINKFMITIFKSEKQLVENFKREAAYKQIFE